MSILKSLTGPVFRVRGEASRNNPGYIKLGMDERPDPSVILAQERYEQVFYRLAMLFIGLPLAAVFTWRWPHLWMGAIVIIILSAAITHIPSFRRWRELRGTALSVALAVRDFGADLETYENIKVASRVNYPGFKGWTIERMKAAFVALRPWANRNCDAWTDGKES